VNAQSGRSVAEFFALAVSLQQVVPVSFFVIYLFHWHFYQVQRYFFADFDDD
jgi:hypothetical protein